MEDEELILKIGADIEKLKLPDGPATMTSVMMECVENRCCLFGCQCRKRLAQTC